ncbi:hypothetical protein [Phaeobacter sp. HF9A]|uniref:hypothetical protein n=1 Tax=Phaeobacter sp. HF9A TaxID=2721561 RepID=UPI001C3772BF|nr:hypothetical protein [Phaeobacter sp. HF9A]NIZ12671.1 hypothetical protein [Phaeobacter sp. HF9A]
MISVLLGLAAGTVQAQDQSWSRRFLAPVDFDERTAGAQMITPHQAMAAQPRSDAVAVPMTAATSDPATVPGLGESLGDFSAVSNAVSNTDAQPLSLRSPTLIVSPGAITFAGLVAAPEIGSAAGQATSYAIGIGWDMAVTPQLHLRGSLLSGEDENGQYSLSPEYRQLALTASFRF